MTRADKILPVGKLPMALLEQLLINYTQQDERVLVGAKVGQDATVIAMGEKYLIAKTDPITFVTDEIGYYSVQINANDIACMGGLPRWFLATVLLPEGQTTEATVTTIFRQIADACTALGIIYCGGHTEITWNLDRPIVIGQMLGEVEPGKLISPQNTQIGDRVLLTKGIAIEAVSIMARTNAEELSQVYSPEFVARCQAFIRNPGLSVVADAQIAIAAGEVHALHDPTEGGLATGLNEMALAAQVGVEIYADRIPVLPEARQLCERYRLNVLGSIASGALLITTPQASAESILLALHDHKIQAVDIGRVVPASEGIHLIEAGQKQKLPVYEPDEITRIFS